MQKMHIKYSIDALTSRTLTYSLEILFLQQHKNIMHINYSLDALGAIHERANNIYRVYASRTKFLRQHSYSQNLPSLMHHLS